MPRSNDLQHAKLKLDVCRILKGLCDCTSGWRVQPIPAKEDLRTHGTVYGPENHGYAFWEFQKRSVATEDFAKPGNLTRKSARRREILSRHAGSLQPRRREISASKNSENAKKNGTSAIF